MEEILKRLHIVFCVDHFNPLGVIRSLGEAGVYPIVILCSEHKSILVRYCKYIKKIHEVGSLDEGRSVLLNYYANARDKNFLYVTSDDIESHLDMHYDELVPYFYFYNSSAKGRITQMMEKSEIVRLANKAGLKTPKTEEVRRGEMPKTLTYPILTKAHISTIRHWKSNVFICHNEEELKTAYQHISCETVLLQEYIEKKDELNIEGFCINDGKDVYMPLQNRFFRTTDTSYGNYLYIEKYNHPEILNKIQKLFELTRYNGIFEMEFMIGKNDELYFLEINFRNSAWLYAYTRCGLNFPLMWAKSMLLSKIVDDDAHISSLPFTLMDELTDFKWSVLSGKVSLFEWLKELKNVNCIFYYNKNDKKPFFMYLLNRLKYLLI